MASKVGIANLALRGLGAVSIASLTEDSENARKVNACYAEVLKSTLRLHPWSFAKKESVLSRLTETPILTDDFTYIYQLPSDFIRLLKTNQEASGYAHKIKGRRIYSDANTLSIEYIYYCDDPTLYDDSFTETLAARIAAEIAYAVTGDKQLIEIKWAEYKQKLAMARSINGQECTPDTPTLDDWMNSRY